MPDANPPRSELERQVLESLTAESAAWLLSLPRTTFLSRKPPRSGDGYSARDVVTWLLAAVADETTSPPGGPSPELERWRKFRADREATAYAKELGVLRLNGLDAERDRRALTILREWATEICGTHPGILARYLRACRLALEHTIRTIPPSNCDVVLKIAPTDGSDPFEIPLGTTGDEPLSMPEIEEWPEPRICPSCGGDLFASWSVAPDGTEAPIWFCRLGNCKTNWKTNRIPRIVGEESAK